MCSKPTHQRARRRASEAALRLQPIVADTIAPTLWRNGGGQTRPLWVHPAGARDDWLVRISLADIETDGPFSAFPGITRHFAVLSGAGVRLRFADGSQQSLAPGSDPLVFDGAQAPQCDLIDGATRDLNLMLRDGVSGCMLSVPSAPLWLAAWSQRAVFTTGAALLVLPDGGQLPLPAQSLLPELPPGPLRLLDAQGPAFWIGTDASSTT